MSYRPTAADFNALFRGSVYGNYDIFTARSYGDFVRRNDIALERAISSFDERLIGTIAFAQRGERAWLSLMGVRPDLRGRGHGKALFGAAVDTVIASGARSIEFEVVQRNVAAIAMYRSFGFSAIDELHVYARRPLRAAANDLAFRRFGERSVTRIANGTPACWQREAVAVVRAAPLALIERDGAYAFVRMRGENGVLVDAGARDAAAAHALLDELDRRVSCDLTLPNEPSRSPLAVAMRERGWRVVERQHRMQRTIA
ncbi:MAG: GNAT family N-acetyltransferase [bacterium]|nr:GNAT family N-acetyltransferase [bacterium]